MIYRISGPLLSTEAGRVKPFIELMIKYRTYSEYPVVLGEFNGFILEVNEESTMESVYLHYRKIVSMREEKVKYLDNGCAHEKDNFYSREELGQLLNDLFSKERDFLFVREGSEQAYAEKYLQKLEVNYEVVETEWEVVELRLL
jgi:hypothetical protein